MKKKKQIGVCVILICIVVAVGHYFKYRPYPENIDEFLANTTLKRVDGFNHDKYSIMLEQYKYDESRHEVAVRVKVSNSKKSYYFMNYEVGENYYSLSEMGIVFYFDQNGTEKPVIKSALECVKGDVYIYVWYSVKEDTYNDRVYVFCDDDITLKEDRISPDMEESDGNLQLPLL